MVTTLRLWDDEESTPPSRPDLDAHHGTLTGYRYGCRCQHCTAAKKDRAALDTKGLRRCQHCANTYPKTTGGGTKFCADCIRTGVYNRHTKKPTPTERGCARCGDTYRKHATAPWNLCPGCTRHPVFDRMKGSLGQHHAPIAVVLAVMDWPYCANEQCGAWLLDRAHHKRHDRAMTRWTYNFAIDHDHTCCPGDRSCGACIRGIICRACNNAMPHTLDATRARGILDYLTRT